MEVWRRFFFFAILRLVRLDVAQFAPLVAKQGDDGHPEAEYQEHDHSFVGSDHPVAVFVAVVVHRVVAQRAISAVPSVRLRRRCFYCESANVQMCFISGVGERSKVKLATVEQARAAVA